METTDFCNYELSKVLKAAGFDEPCEAFYLPPMKNRPEPFFSGRVKHSIKNETHAFHLSAPSLYHAQKWLREKKRIAINVIAHDTSDKYREGKYHWEEVYLPNFSEEGHQWADWFIYGKHPLFDTYEEALSDGLSQMLELIKKGK